MLPHLYTSSPVNPIYFILMLVPGTILDSFILLEAVGVSVSGVARGEPTGHPAP